MFLDIFSSAKEVHLTPPYLKTIHVNKYPQIHISTHMTQDLGWESIEMSSLLSSSKCG